MYHIQTYHFFMRKSFRFSVFFYMFIALIISCGRQKKPVATEIVSQPEKMDETIEKLIPKLLDFALSDSGKIDDSMVLNQPDITGYIYKEYGNNPLWSKQEKWLPYADSLYNFIGYSKRFGLFPADYHFNHLKSLRTRFDKDSLGKGDRIDAALWARADILLTDAFIRILKDIKLGRLPQDSITLRKDSVLTSEFFVEKSRAVFSGNPFRLVISSLEPRHKGYHELKVLLNDFLDRADFKEYSFINFPDKDSIRLRMQVAKRLIEAGWRELSLPLPDSAQLALVLKKYQKENALTPDGKIGAQTIRSLNHSDREKFIRIAINLDRYKLLPEKMPEQYIWVNIPSFKLKLVNSDSVKIISRIVVGKPKTRTPVLNSAVSEMITYPQWTIPQSIIVKEILPALKKDPGYLAEKGYSLINKDGEEIDPYSVDWSKYTKGIPYRIVQGSGDENALGVIKFNFRNKYAVYLHDTNQRYYFSRDSRALSHGCVRVQEWEEVATYMLQNDSIHAVLKNTRNYTPADSVWKWLALKEKHVVPVRNRVPLFIRYFTCEPSDEKIIFYEDIYDEDKVLKEIFFQGK